MPVCQVSAREIAHGASMSSAVHMSTSFAGNWNDAGMIPIVSMEFGPTRTDCPTMAGSAPSVRHRRSLMISVMGPP